MSNTVQSVTVVHGTDRKSYALVGMSVREAIQLLNNEIYNGLLTGLTWLLNGQTERELTGLGGDSIELRPGDELSFLSRGGDKGVVAVNVTA